MTAAELARRVGMSPSGIAHYEIGWAKSPGVLTRPAPSIGLAIEICRVLDVGLDVMLGAEPLGLLDKWAPYRRCGACGAALGKPCRSLSGFVPDAQGGVVEVEADAPHPGRKLRAGYGR